MRMSENTQNTFQSNPFPNYQAQNGHQPGTPFQQGQSFQMPSQAQNQPQFNVPNSPAESLPKLDPNKPLIIGDEDAHEVELIQVRLVGVDYQMPQPKSGALINMARKAKTAETSKDQSAMLDIILDWVVAAFGKEQGNHINERLNNALDPLDIEHVTKLMGQVLNTSGGDNPST